MNLTGVILYNKWLRLRLRRKDLDPRARLNLQALRGLDLDLPAREGSYVVLDLETTGLNPRKDRVVSMGALRIRNGRIQLNDVFSEMVNPGRGIPAESILVHGVTTDMIRDAPSGPEAFDRFLNFLGQDILIAHYAPLDLHFLNKVMKAGHGFRLQNLVVDTVLMCRTALIDPDPYGVRLGARRCGLDGLLQRYNLYVPERHTALGDAYATALIFQRLLPELEKKGWTTLRDLINVAGEW